MVEIPEGIFKNCSSLSELFFEDYLSNQPQVVRNGNDVTAVTPDSFAHTGTIDYLDNNSLASTVKVINPYAFYGCTALQGILFTNA